MVKLNNWQFIRILTITYKIGLLELFTSSVVYPNVVSERKFIPFHYILASFTIAVGYVPLNPATTSPTTVEIAVPQT